MKRVFLISDQSLFGSGIESLLVQNTSIEIIGLENDLNVGVEFIKRHKPNVVIINCENPELDIGATLVSVLQEQLGICVVCLELKGNQMYVYRGEQKQVHHLEDLFEVILE
jgi:chemotaxis response regulator CheB